MAGLTLRGGPELKARLDSLAQVPPQFLGQWQFDTTKGARSGAPARTGRGRASIHPGKLTATRAEVRGAFWLIFVDRGTKAHDIVPKGLSGSGRGGKSDTRVLVFPYHGRTIFTRKVHKRRQAKRPFLTRAAQDALRGSKWADVVLRAWSRKAQRRGFGKLAL